MISNEQILMFKKSADTLYDSQDYTSATILYFKTWFALQDKILLDKIGVAPKDHRERFRLLEKYYDKTYVLLDKEFNTYRDTYSRIVSLQTCKRIKKLVENEIDYHKIK